MPKKQSLSFLHLSASRHGEKQEAGKGMVQIMASINIHFKVYRDPLFKELIAECKKSRALSENILKLAENKKLVEICVQGSKIVWHLSDAALDLLYQAKALK